MNTILGTLSCIGMLTVAGLCGVALGWIEKKAVEQDEERGKHERHP